MLVIVSARVRDMVERGLSLDQVKAARPSLDYDGRYATPSGAHDPRRRSSRPSTTTPLRRAATRRPVAPDDRDGRSHHHVRDRRRRVRLDDLDRRRSRVGGAGSGPGPGAGAGGRSRTRRAARAARRPRAGAHRPHRQLGGHRHRGLPLANGHAAEGRRLERSGQPRRAEGRRGVGPGQGQRRRNCSARRLASAASCDSRAACGSRGRTRRR